MATNQKKQDTPRRNACVPAPLCSQVTMHNNNIITLLYSGMIPVLSGSDDLLARDGHDPKTRYGTVRHNTVPYLLLATPGRTVPFKLFLQ